MTYKHQPQKYIPRPAQMVQPEDTLARMRRLATPNGLAYDTQRMRWVEELVEKLEHLQRVEALLESWVQKRVRVTSHRGHELPF